MRNQATDAQRITGEILSSEGAVLLRVWHRAVGPEMRRNIRLGVLTVGIKPFDETLEPADDKAAGFLNPPRMPDRERRGDSPSNDDDGHRRDENSETRAPIIVYAGEHLIHIAPESSDKDHCHVNED